MRPAFSGACLAVTAVLGGCGAPPASPSGFTGEAAVQVLVTEILDTMQQQSYKRNNVDWPALRSAVLARMQGADRMPDAFPAVQLALQMHNDSHTRYVARTGNTLVHWTLDCTTAGVEPAVVPAGIGYIRVTSTSSTVSADYAGAMQAAIRAADHDDLAGWIVDLRGNGGGSTYAMVAGIGPILGEGTAGSFVTVDGAKTEWGYRASSGATSNGTLVVVPSTIYQLRRPNPRVAILSDRSNMSAGESTLISFMGRPDTRVFGGASCGVSTGVGGLTMRDGATLWLARSVMADRTGRLYGGPVPPHEAISDQKQQVARAVQWLQSGQ